MEKAYLTLEGLYDTKCPMGNFETGHYDGLRVFSTKEGAFKYAGSLVPKKSRDVWDMEGDGGYLARYRDGKPLGEHTMSGRQVMIIETMQVDGLVKL